jgi:hypothetical protein
LTSVRSRLTWSSLLRVARLPTRKEQALKPLYVMIGSAGIVILWIELFWRYCL